MMKKRPTDVRYCPTFYSDRGIYVIDTFNNNGFFLTRKEATSKRSSRGEKPEAVFKLSRIELKWVKKETKSEP